MRVKLTISGVDEVRKRLERIGADTAKEYIREAGMEGAKLIQADAARRVNLGPHKEHLRDSIVIEEVRDSDARIDFAIGPDRDHWYGRLVEFGHRNVKIQGYFQRKAGGRRYRILTEHGQTPPHPFLRPALDENRREAQQRVVEVLRRRLGL